MKVETLEIPKKELEKELKSLKIAVKNKYISRRNKLTRDLLSVYGHLQHGGAIIDIFDTFQKVGLNPKQDSPKLAIVNCGAKLCYLYKIRNGGAIFSKERKGWSIRVSRTSKDVQLPPDTFNWQNLEDNRLKCAVPIIPPRIAVQISAKILPNYYHVLFEPEGWTKSSPP